MILTRWLSKLSYLTEFTRLYPNMLTSVLSSSFLRYHIYNLAHLCLIYPSIVVLYCVEGMVMAALEGLFLKFKTHFSY